MIKIDIVTGFLGAGKTTLIKKILKYVTSFNEKVVLIENEFGEIGIDGEIVKREGIEVYELSQGCICCTLKSDFEYALKEIIEKLKPDRMIFEPSGIFIPDEVISLLHLPDFSGKCALSSVIAVVDGKNYLKQHKKYGMFFNRQIAAANVLAVSKTQFVTAEDTEKIVHSLRNINSHAQVIAKNWDDFREEDLDTLLNQGVRAHIQDLIHSECPECCGGHPHARHSHEAFDMYGTRTSKVFEAKEPETFLQHLRLPEYGDVVRGKGFLKTTRGCVEFSYVNGDFTITPLEGDCPGLVSFIGKGLNKEALARYFTP